MPRKTQQNNITSPELLEQINPDNKQLLEDYMLYLESVQRSPKTIFSYKNDLEIFFVWLLQHAKNKFFVDITKRDIIAYQNWLLTVNKNSPARIRRLKSTLSSLANYIEAVLDEDYPKFRNFINKIESPVNTPVREKTVLSDEQCDLLLKTLVDNKKYDKACMAALAMSSGRRKAELVRYKVHYFDDENIIYGSLYKTPEKMKTKGRGGGKMLTCYTMVKDFKPYFDLWMEERERKGIESEWLFPDKNDPTQHMNPDTLNSWSLTYSNILGVPVYIHAFRHRFTTHLAVLGLPDNIIQSILGWSDISLVSVYKDIEAEDEFGDYFSEDGIVAKEKTKLSDL